METSIRLKLGRRIKALRGKYSYTQEELSRLIGIDYKYLQKIEGKNPPNLKLETLQRVAKAFKMSISKFLDF